MLNFKKSAAALLLTLSFASTVFADSATLSNRYNYARSELMRLEELCGVTPMVNRGAQSAPWVSYADIISFEEVLQFEARIAELKDCKRPEPMTQEILTGVPVSHVALISNRFQQVGKTVYIAISVNDQCGFAQKLTATVLSTLDSNDLYCLIANGNR